MSLNLIITRLLSMQFGSSIIALKNAHLIHHKYNRTQLERPDILDKLNNNLAKKISFYLNILGGIYLKEILLPILSFLPLKLIQKIQNKMPQDSINYKFLKIILNNTNIQTLRFEALISYTYLFTSLYLFYIFNKTNCFIIIYLLRAFIISVHDYSYHYHTKLDSVIYARDIKTPISLLILNFNFHGTHHIFPNAPWYQLPALSNKISNKSKKEDSLLRPIINQFHGPTSSRNLE